MVNFMRIGEKLDYLLDKKTKLNSDVDRQEKIIKAIKYELKTLKENKFRHPLESYSSRSEGLEYQISKHNFLIEELVDEIARIGRKRIELSKKFDSGCEE